MTPGKSDLTPSSQVHSHHRHHHHHLEKLIYKCLLTQYDCQNGFLAIQLFTLLSLSPPHPTLPLLVLLINFVRWSFFDLFTMQEIWKSDRLSLSLCGGWDDDGFFATSPHCKSNKVPTLPRQLPKGSNIIYLSWKTIIFLTIFNPTPPTFHLFKVIQKSAIFYWGVFFCCSSNYQWYIARNVYVNS